MANYEQNSAPYSADVLAVHDKNLVFYKSFGTNITANVGDQFKTVAGGSASAQIDSRLAMLNLRTPAAVSEQAPAGRSFLTPNMLDPKLFPPAPNLGDLQFSVLYAHVLLGQEFPTGATWAVDLILGRVGLIGDAFAEPFFLCSLLTESMIVVAPEVVTPPYGPFQSIAASQSFWATGAGGPVAELATKNLGNDVYFRVIMSTDGVKTTCDAAVSQKGVQWMGMAGGSFSGVLGRVGLGVRGIANGLLDWFRIYSYVPTGNDDNGLVPPPPQTGGRLYVP